VIRAPRIVLATDQSETLRDRLVTELSDLKSADEAADWVHKNLPVKNTLTPADAELVLDVVTCARRYRTLWGVRRTGSSPGSPRSRT
jgi:hypothetical protein